MFLIQPPQVRQPLLGVRPVAGSPLTRGLVLAVLPGQGWVNLADNRALTVSGAQPLRATGAQGPGAYVGSGATNLLQASITLGNAYTLMALASPVSGQTQAFIDDDDAATRAFQFRWGSTDSIDFIPFDLVGNALSVSTTSASVASNRAAGVCAVASITSSGSIALTTRWETVTGSLGATTATPAATIALLNRKVGGTQTPSQGPIYLLAAWNRTLSVPEARALAGNPWQIFTPRARRLWAAVGASAFTAVITEPATAADVSTATATKASAITEATTAADSSTVTATKSQAITEAAAAAESSTAVLGLFSAIAEAASATDASSQTATKTSTVTEPASAADSSAASGAFTAAATEATTAADSSTATAAGNFSAVITEAASAADSSAAAGAATASITEPASAADSSAATGAFTVAVTEATTAADSSTASAAGNFSAVITEAASAADASSQTATKASAITEPAAAADTSTSIATKASTITEAASAADSSTALPSGSYAAGATEAAAAADVSTSTATKAAGITEAATASDAAAGLRAALAAILEPVNPIDVSGATLNAVGPAVTAAGRGLSSNLSGAARLPNLATGARPSNLSTGRRGPSRARS